MITVTIPTTPELFKCGGCPSEGDQPYFWEFADRVRMLRTDDGPIPVCPDCSRFINQCRLRNEKPLLWDGLL